MSKLNHYTIEVYKADKRIKKDARYGRDKKGLRFVDATNYAPSTKAYIDTVAKNLVRDGFVVQVFETWVIKKNMMTGQEFTERYDTPSFCSPSSESYWSM
jgi:hypothetical protein